MKVLFLVLVACCSVSCSIGISADNSNSNSSIPCKSSQDCRSSMVCISNLCRVSNLAIAHVLVDVELPASTNSTQYSGMGFVLPLDVPTLGRADITLPGLATLSLDANFQSIPNARPVDDAGASKVCDYTFGSDNGNTVQLEVIHRWPVDGLERSVFTVTSLPATIAAIPADSEFYYEVYIAPTFSTGCQLPPVLVRDVGLSGDRSLALAWPQPKTIALDVQIQSNKLCSPGESHWLGSGCRGPD